MLTLRMGNGTLKSWAGLWTLMLCLTTLSSCGDSDETYLPLTLSAEEQQKVINFSAEEQQKMATVVQDAMDKGNIPGIIVGVWSGNKEWILAKGVSDIATGNPMQQTMNVRIGSITKSITATVILQLVDEGRLALDDPVSSYVAGIPNGDAISIRQLLNMSSGLVGYTEVGNFEYQMTHDPLKAWTPDELIALGISQNPKFAPGQGFYYSNTNYVILGKIIEKVTGNSVKNEIQNRIAKPLGLTGTYMPDTPFMPPNSTRGYYYDIVKGGDYLDVTTEEARNFAWTAGGVISNLQETKQYIRALGNGTLLSSRIHAAQLTLNPYSKFEDRYGYGLGISYVNGYIGHNGSIPGWNSSAYYHPQRDITIVVLANKWKIPNLTLGTDSIFINLGKTVTPDLNWSLLDQ